MRLSLRECSIVVLAQRIGDDAIIALFGGSASELPAIGRKYQLSLVHPRDGIVL